MRKTPTFTEWLAGRVNDKGPVSELATYVLTHKIPNSDDRKMLRERLRTGEAPQAILHAFDTAWRVFRA
jgi:hypothetical protein